jgi:hypothetical protein
VANNGMSFLVIERLEDIKNQDEKSVVTPWKMTIIIDEDKSHKFENVLKLSMPKDICRKKI